MAEWDPLKDWGRVLLVLGLLLAAAGAVLLFAGRIPGLGRLPGDLVVQRGRWTLYFPVTTMILISIVLTVLLNLFFRK